MWKLQKATNLLIRFILILVFTAYLLNTTQALSDKRLCADENCKEIISLGIGKINYRAGAEGMVSFKINSPIRIKSKSAGSDPSLWGIEVNGREGYAPKEFIRETKIKVSEKNLKYIVDVNSPSAVPILNTSEKTVEQENIVEATTTKPLSAVPLEATEKPVINNNTNENITTETPAEATPVISEIVDGTPIPIFGNDSDGIVETVHEEVQPLNKYVEEEDDYDDDEIGDYDEDEEEELLYKEDAKLPNKEVKQDDPIDLKSKVKVESPSEGISQNQLGKVEDNDALYKNVIEETTKVIATSSVNKEVISESVDEIESKNLEALNDPLENRNENEVISKEINEGNPSDVPQIPKVLNYTLDENVAIPKDIEKQKILNNSNENIDEVDENQLNKENDEENSVSEKQSEEKLENANVEPVITKVNVTPPNYIQENFEEIDANKLDKHDTPINDNNLNVEQKTDNTIETNDNSIDNHNSKDNDNSNDNTNINANPQLIQDQELSMSDTNEHILTTTETQVNDDNKNDNNSMQQEEISTTESSYYQQEHEQQTEEFYNVNPTDIPAIDTQLPIEQNITIPVTISEADVKIEASTESQQFYEDAKLSEQSHSQEQNVIENINPTYSPYNEVSVNTPSSHSPYDYNYQQVLTTEIPPNDGDVTTESNPPYYEPYEEQNTVAYNSIPTIPPETTSNSVEKKHEGPKALPSLTPSTTTDENKEKKGLFATIMGTVNNVLSINKKHKHSELEDDNELDRILYSKNGDGHKVEKLNEEDSLQYCKKLGPNGDCPQSEYIHGHGHDYHQHLQHQPNSESSINSLFRSDLTLDAFLKALASKILELSELLAFLVIAAAASLFFIFGYYCFCNSSREGALLSKLNQLESSLLATHKENSILKHNLMSTRQKLASIEDNSFGSNDMVVSLKKELEEELMEKARLQEQITVLQKELENAADAGIELNKIVAELLSNQTGDESIISSVEELQKQLNEQQNTILEINASLAEKSRENSELQLLIAEQNARYESQLANVQRDNDELEHEKGNLLTKLEELKNDFDKDITAALEGKNFEIKRLQKEIVDLSNKVENEHTKWQTSVAKIEALEECLKNVRKDPNVNITEVIDVANVKAQLIETQKKYTSLKERLEIELDQRKIAENQLQMLSAEVEKLKQDFNQSEKDKLEAQTRLEVLSNYFKDKENQLQKELSLKEAMWLKQQGETTTTVDRVTAMQEEIQSLKSQNDALRAEIEAQVAAHKAQTGTLENRAHETWLAARQSDRRYEEARAEATALRRKLTALAGGNVNEVNKTSAGTAGLGDELPQAPSPIHMEPPGSPLLSRMPPPPFLPPPFMGPPPPFMGMPPPPPFVPPGEMRPAPLGRIMSPPPQRAGRFSPQHLDYEDYLDYEGSNTWHRHTYSPPPRTYRSLSPTDSRYNYGTERDLMSTYDTETDFSPPPSPRESRRRGVNSSERIDNNKSPYGSSKKFGNKGLLSSGSEKSYNSPSHHDTKSKKGSTSGGGGKNLV